MPGFCCMIKIHLWPLSSCREHRRDRRFWFMRVKPRFKMVRQQHLSQVYYRPSDDSCLSRVNHHFE